MRRDILNAATVSLWIMNLPDGQPFSTEQIEQELGLSEFEVWQAIGKIEKMQGLPGIPSIGRLPRKGEDA